MTDSDEPSGGRNSERERQAARDLDEAAGTAIDLALGLAPEVADAPSAGEAERYLDIEVATLSEATFVRKRVNTALSVHEWLDQVAVWVWQAGTHQRPPLSERGRERGFEIRLEQVPKS